jgi:hypothetical protein
MTNVASDNAQVAELTLELAELRGRQEALADILRALASSGLRLQPILDQIVETAARLCRAETGFLYLADGELLRMRGNFGQPEEVATSRATESWSSSTTRCLSRSTSYRRRSSRCR